MSVRGGDEKRRWRQPTPSTQHTPRADGEETQGRSRAQSLRVRRQHHPRPDRQAPSPRPAPVNLEDVPEFQDELRRQRQASQAQLVIQVVMVTTLIVRWFRGRNKPKPKPPRTPSSRLR